jgi:protein TonB
MIESLRIFAADQVDTPAALATTSTLDIEYPPELYSTSVSGSVLAEFVVDTTGSIEQETVSIVASSHPLFSAATIKALQNAHFAPAVKGGVRVRQVVQQPFSFVPGQRKSADAR